MVGLLLGVDRCVGAGEEVDAGVGDEVDLELVHVDVEGAWREIEGERERESEKKSNGEGKKIGRPSKRRDAVSDEMTCAMRRFRF